MEQVFVHWKSLWEFAKQVFVQVGMSPEAAEIEADVLVWANLRGVDSHGVQRIPGYVKAAKEGRYNIHPHIRTEKETAAVLFVEADHAFGPVVTVYAMEQVMKKAKNVGVGWGLIRNTTHQGAMGYYTLMAAKRDMAGIAWVCNPPNMAPTGARAAGVHNSPIAISVPAKEHRPLILDMATSVAARGKVDVAADKGEPIPEGWALDKDGKPTTDPRQVAVMLPAGGYKGYGLALMFECLSSVMAGNPLLSPKLLGLDSAPPLGSQNSVIAAINIGTFTDVEKYKRDIDDLIRGLKTLPKAEGYDEILVPGELEDRTYDQRSQRGIPLPLGTVQRLRAVAEELGVAMPDLM